MDIIYQGVKSKSLREKMIKQTKQVEIKLGPKEVIRLQGDRRGTRITSMDGQLWITQSGDDQDYLLDSGQSFIVNRRGAIALQALPTARAIIQN